jgi:hypothetical protein
LLLLLLLIITTIMISQKRSSTSTAAIVSHLGRPAKRLTDAHSEVSLCVCVQSMCWPGTAPHAIMIIRAGRRQASGRSVPLSASSRCPSSRWFCRVARLVAVWRAREQIGERETQEASLRAEGALLEFSSSCNRSTPPASTEL